MLSHTKRITLIVIGFVSLALAVIGIFVPLLPTTPLVLVSAIAFANSSERWHQWLLDHKVFGPLIANWRRHGAISRLAKIASLVSMVAIVVISLLVAVPTWIIVIQVLVLGAAATFIVSRPQPPR